MGHGVSEVLTKEAQLSRLRTGAISGTCLALISSDEMVPGTAREARAENHVQKRASGPDSLVALPESAPHTIVRPLLSTHVDVATAEQ